MDGKDFPRVVFLTPCAFNSVTGTGVTFSNLFRDWPKERLATITDDRVPVSLDVCEKYFFLSDRELSYAPPFRWFRRRTAQTSSLASETRPALPLGHWAKKMIGTAGIPDRGRLSRRLQRWLEAFRPDLVYTILGTLGYFDLLEAMTCKQALPFVIHVMDHGTVDPLRTGLFRNYLRRGCARRMRALASRAAGCLAIGEAMAREYTRCFGRPFLHFQNAAELERYPARSTQVPAGSRPARLVYVGSIFPYAQLQSLIDTCQAVQALNRCGCAIDFEIHTPLKLFGSYQALLAIDPAIRVHEAPTTDDGFFALLQKADALLLPVNFDAASVHYIRLSMPTKLPSYLASGVPILVYGPETVCQVEYALKHRWGHVVGRRSGNLLQEGIREIMGNAALRGQLAQNSLQTARRYHDARQVRAEFQEMLIAVGGPTSKWRPAAAS